jgi:hypothetical protein
VQILHLLLSIFAVENSGAAPKWLSRKRNGFPLKKEMTMRIVETAAMGLVALAAQMIVVATVLM